MLPSLRSPEFPQSLLFHGSLLLRCKYTLRGALVLQPIEVSGIWPPMIDAASAGRRLLMYASPNSSVLAARRYGVANDEQHAHSEPLFQEPQGLPSLLGIRHIDGPRSPTMGDPRPLHTRTLCSTGKIVLDRVHASPFVPRTRRGRT